MKESMENLRDINWDWKKIRLNEIISRLDADDTRESLQKALESLPGFKESFRELDTIDCSDGRVLDGRKIGIAGSGILLSQEERDRFIDRYKGKIKVLTTHADCGAAGIAFKALKSEEIPMGVTTSDEYGTYCGQKTAEALGAEHKFLTREQMSSQEHNEAAIVLDATGEFDSTHLQEFPPHFVCTGAGLGFSEEYIKTELKTLAGIALGHHGLFHANFSHETPFYVIVAASNKDDLARWETAAQEAIADFKEKIVVRGFIRPDAEK